MQAQSIEDWARNAANKYFESCVPERIIQFKFPSREKAREAKKEIEKQTGIVWRIAPHERHVWLLFPAHRTQAN